MKKLWMVVSLAGVLFLGLWSNISFSATTADEYYKQACDFYDQGNYLSAIELFNKTLQSDPAKYFTKIKSVFIESIYTYAYNYSIKGDYEQALFISNAIIKYFPDWEITKQVKELSSNCEKNIFQEFEHEFNKIASEKEETKDINTCNELVALHSKIDLFKNKFSGLSNLDRYNELSKKCIEEKGKVEELIALKEKKEKELSVFRENKESLPVQSVTDEEEKHAEADKYYTQGCKNYDRKKYSEALKNFKKAFELIPDDSACNYMLSITCNELGQTKEAANFAYKAMVTDPFNDAGIGEKAEELLKELKQGSQGSQDFAQDPSDGYQGIEWWTPFPEVEKALLRQNKQIIGKREPSGDIGGQPFLKVKDTVFGLPATVEYICGGFRNGQQFLLWSVTIYFGFDLKYNAEKNKMVSRSLECALQNLTKMYGSPEADADPLGLNYNSERYDWHFPKGSSGSTYNAHVWIEGNAPEGSIMSFQPQTMYVFSH